MSEFKEISNGYKYKLVNNISCDGQMCSVDIEIERYGSKTDNIDEINRYISELITVIMKNDFKEKYKSFNTSGCIRQVSNNTYELDWTINMKKGKYKILKEFCEGNEIEILSGALINKKGKYVVKEKGSVFNRITEYACIENKEYELKGFVFKFSDDYDQITYEEIINDR